MNKIKDSFSKIKASDEFKDKLLRELQANPTKLTPDTKKIYYRPSIAAAAILFILIGIISFKLIMNTSENGTKNLGSIAYSPETEPYTDKDYITETHEYNNEDISKTESSSKNNETVIPSNKNNETVITSEALDNDMSSNIIETNISSNKIETATSYNPNKTTVASNKSDIILSSNINETHEVNSKTDISSKANETTITSRTNEPDMPSNKMSSNTKEVSRSSDIRKNDIYSTGSENNISLKTTQNSLTDKINQGDIAIKSDMPINETTISEKVYLTTPDNIAQAKFQTFSDWNNGTGTFYTINDSDLLNNLLNEINKGTPYLPKDIEASLGDYRNDAEIKEISFDLKDSSKNITFTLLRSGYVYSEYQGIYLKIDANFTKELWHKLGHMQIN